MNYQTVYTRFIYIIVLIFMIVYRFYLRIDWWKYILFSSFFFFIVHGFVKATLFFMKKHDNPVNAEGKEALDETQDENLEKNALGKSEIDEIRDYESLETEQSDEIEDFLELSDPTQVQEAMNKETSQGMQSSLEDEKIIVEGIGKEKYTFEAKQTANLISTILEKKDKNEGIG